jgi:hypothetical protein
MDNCDRTLHHIQGFFFFAPRMVFRKAFGKTIVDYVARAYVHTPPHAGEGASFANPKIETLS